MGPKAAKPPCTVCGKVHLRGGCRPNAGAKRKNAIGEAVQRSVAVEVLNRLPELKLVGVRTEADYVLYRMREFPREAGVLFTDMLNRAHGKPAQSVIAEGKLTIEVVELGSADHSSTQTKTAAGIV
jgi:hypothetical protein